MGSKTCSAHVQLIVDDLTTRLYIRSFPLLSPPTPPSTSAPRSAFLLYAKRISWSPHRDKIPQEDVHSPLSFAVFGHQQPPLQLPRPIVPRLFPERPFHRQQARCLAGVPHRRRHATHAAPAPAVTPSVGGALEVESVCTFPGFEASEQAPKRVSVSICTPEHGDIYLSHEDKKAWTKGRSGGLGRTVHAYSYARSPLIRNIGKSPHVPRAVAPLCPPRRGRVPNITNRTKAGSGGRAGGHCTENNAKTSTSIILLPPKNWLRACQARQPPQKQNT